MRLIKIYEYFFGRCAPSCHTGYGKDRPKLAAAKGIDTSRVWIVIYGLYKSALGLQRRRPHGVRKEGSMRKFFFALLMFLGIAATAAVVITSEEAQACCVERGSR